jgi:glycosyltransferase involved in cell wall biosynthesis
VLTIGSVTDDFEVIVVDDGSSDYTPEILDESARRYPGVVRVVHHEKNKGHGGALRTGFSASTKDLFFTPTAMRTQYDVFDKVHLEHNSGIICVELMKKVQMAGFRLAEAPVHHYHRAYGRSQFFNFRRLARVGIDLIGLWWELVGQRRLTALRKIDTRREWK